MIEKIEDLDLKKEDTQQDLDQILQEKLGVSLSAMTVALQQYTQEHAEKLASNFLVMVPNGDYGRLLEDQIKIASFIREEAGSPDNWVAELLSVYDDKKQPPMLKVAFLNKAVDDGNSMSGYVFVSFSGNILHSFVHGDP
jgi:hypothetical protein